jgi:hypothetical protein
MRTRTWDMCVEMSAVLLTHITTRAQAQHLANQQNVFISMSRGVILKVNDSVTIFMKITVMSGKTKNRLEMEILFLNNRKTSVILAIVEAKRLKHTFS